MSRKGHKGALDGEDRRRAVAFARSAASRARDTVPAKRKPPAFDTLGEAQKVRKIREIGAALKIEDPFFRSHAGRASARSVVDGRDCLNFASYDYLGLNGDPRVAAAARDAIETYGTSPSASRLVAGERPVHRALETALARHYGVEDAVVFVSGHATNVTAIGEIMGPNDLILHDSYIHNSILKGAELSGASRRSFPHNDLTALSRMLSETRESHRHVLVVVEGLYSMDGDLPDLPGLLELRDRFGFWLMVDEAHALGAVGEKGGGSAEHFGIDPTEVDIWMGTLSKTLAATGGYIAGSAALVELLKTQASGFVYSVGLSPPLAAAANAALDILEAEPQRVAKLRANSERFMAKAKAVGLDTGLSQGFSVVPVMIGDSLFAGKLCERLFQKDINVLPIAFPAVPMQAARLRFFMTSAHDFDQIDHAVGTVRAELDRLLAEGIDSHIPPDLARVLFGDGAG